jgi:hypothetical protein
MQMRYEAASRELVTREAKGLRSKSRIAFIRYGSLPLKGAWSPLPIIVPSPDQPLFVATRALPFNDFHADDLHILANKVGRGGNPPVPVKTFSAHNARAMEYVTEGGPFLYNPSYCESYRPTARRGTPFANGSRVMSLSAAQNQRRS